MKKIIVLLSAMLPFTANATDILCITKANLGGGMVSVSLKKPEGNVKDKLVLNVDGRTTHLEYLTQVGLKDFDEARNSMLLEIETLNQQGERDRASGRFLFFLDTENTPSGLQLTGGGKVLVSQRPGDGIEIIRTKYPLFSCRGTL